MQLKTALRDGFRFSWRLLVAGCLLLISVPSCRRGHVLQREPRARPRSLSIPHTITSPLDMGLSSDAKQAFVDLVRYRLNLSLPPGDQATWDLWAEGSSPFPLPSGERAFLLSFRRVAASSRVEGLLVIGLLKEEMPVLVAQWRTRGSIDDMHPVDMGPPVGTLVHVVAMGPAGRFQLLQNHLLRLEGSKLRSVWHLLGGYSQESPEVFLPPVIRFRDLDGNDAREVLVRIPTRGKRSRRIWAVFRWDTYLGRYVPVKGLARSPIALQQPDWAVAGFLEAVSRGEVDELGRFVAYPRRGCVPSEELADLLGTYGLRPVAPARLSKEGEWRVPMKGDTGGARFEARFSLIEHSGPIPEWRICRMRLLKW